ncbi:glycosyltransferase family 25 protein [Planctomicrobium sp. SH527]|uniref:glycosyltransferase family 25 protein n=1 Tax=Planctomicrobium sp. SH527 TaxID=3448123 RepID=UPI003F5BF064
MSVAIPKVQLINLDRDHERLRWMEKQFEKVGVSFTRFSAITPKTIPPEIAARFTSNPKPNLKPNERAVLASHICLLTQIAEHGGDGWYIICEDDLEIDPSFPDLFQCDRWASEFDILRLNGIPKAPTFEVGRFKNWKLIRYLRVPNGTGAYAITRVGAQKLLASAWDLDMPVDTYMRHAFLHKLNSGGILPPVVTQDVLASSTTDPEGLRVGSPRPKYAARGYSYWHRMTYSLQLTRELGVMQSLKYLRYLLEMKIRRVLTDPQGGYSINS